MRSSGSTNTWIENRGGLDPKRRGWDSAPGETLPSHSGSAGRAVGLSRCFCPQLRSPCVVLGVSAGIIKQKMLPSPLLPHAFSVVGKGGLIGGVVSFINPNTEEERILLPFQPGLTLGTESSLDSSAGHLFSRFTLRRCSLLTDDPRDLGSGCSKETRGDSGTGNVLSALEQRWRVPLFSPWGRCFTHLGVLLPQVGWGCLPAQLCRLECSRGVAAPSSPSVSVCSAGVSQLCPCPNCLSAVVDGRRDQCEVPRDPKFPDCAGKVEVSWGSLSGRGSRPRMEGAGKGPKYRPRRLKWEEQWGGGCFPHHTRLL